MTHDNNPNESRSSFAALSNHEKNVLLPLVLNMLQHRKDKELVFSNTKIRKVLKEFGQDILDSQIRKLVFYIRNNDLLDLLIANNDGYYIATNIQDIEKWLEMQRGKIAAMHESLSAIQRQMTKHKQALIEGGETHMTGQMSIFDFLP
jgi:hypothetical protein